MLRLAGTYADGTTTWMTGEKTIREHIVPRIREAAEEAGKPEPRIIALMPVAVTGERRRLHQTITEEMAIYHHMPSYQAMLEREGASEAGDIALLGSAGEVEDALNRLEDAGVTDFGAILFGTDDEQEATRELLTAHAGRSHDITPTIEEALNDH